jgi:HEAT repeat protein
MDVVALLRDEDTEVRLRGVHALAELGGPEAISLARGMLDDPDDDVCLEALSLIAALDTEAGVTEAVARLKSADAAMRALSIEIIASHLSAEASLELWDVVLPLIGDLNESVRQVARWYLRTRLVEVIPDAAARAESPIDWIRAVHTAWLAEHDPVAAIELSSSDSSPVVRLALVEQLTSIGSAEETRLMVIRRPEVVGAFLTDPDRLVRRAALDFPGL